MGFFTLIALIVEAGFAVLAIRLAGHAQLAALYGIIGTLVLLIAVVAAIAIFRSAVLTASEQNTSLFSGRDSATDRLSIGRNDILDFKDLAGPVLDVLWVKGGRRQDLHNEVKILAADTANLWGVRESVINAEWLRNTSFEFALVDPDFWAAVEIDDQYRDTEKGALQHIWRAVRDRKLADREVNVKPPRRYKFHPNV